MGMVRSAALPALLAALGLVLSPAPLHADSIPAPAPPPADTVSAAPAAPPSPAAVASPMRFQLGLAEAGWVPAALGLQAWAQYRYHSMPVVHASQLDQDDLWAMDRWAAGTWSEGAAHASDYLIYPLVAAPMAISTLAAWRGDATWGSVANEAVVYAEAMAISSALCLLVRSTRIHPRPFQYGREAPDRERRKTEASGSFYSGHSSTAFLSATWIAMVYPRRNPGFEHAGLLWTGALGYAGTVAVLRVAAGKHFPSDVVAGAAAGVLLGWLFPTLRMHDGPGGVELRALPRPEGVHPVLVYRF